MPDKNDIVQIKKYFNGELNARAMHELERRALDDPFLMEALEGYEQNGPEQQANLDDIHQRLQERVEDKKVKRMIPWLPLSIAASVLIIIGAGIFFLTGDKSQKQPGIAQAVAPELKKTLDTVAVPSKNSSAQALADNTTTPTSKTFTIPQKRIAANKLAKTDVPPSVQEIKPAQQFSSADVSPAAKAPPENADANAVYKSNNDKVSVDETIVSNYKTNKKDSLSLTRHVPSPPIDILKSKADGVTVNSEESIPGRVTHMKTLNGVVIAQDNGLPLPGATVRVVGSRFGAVTDANGKFALSNVDNDQTLSVGSLGYAPRKVKVSDKDSLSISLRPNSSALSEVVVVNPTAQKTADKEAHPRDGWKALETYLEKNAISPDGQTGKVKLSFTVAADGTLSNFKIVKSLSKVADQKAIDLVQNGTLWVGGADGIPKDVAVTVKFH